MAAEAARTWEILGRGVAGSRSPSPTVKTGIAGAGIMTNGEIGACPRWARVSAALGESLRTPPRTRPEVSSEVQSESFGRAIGGVGNLCRAGPTSVANGEIGACSGPPPSRTVKSVSWHDHTFGLCSEALPLVSCGLRRLRHPRELGKRFLFMPQANL
jgi:hypothetical protein